MSERKVTWTADANLGPVRREADRTARSVENLDDRLDHLGETSEATGEKVEKSNERTAKSRDRDARAAREQTNASTRSSAALDREGKSSSTLGGILSRLADARRRESSAAKEQSSSGRAVQAARTAEAKAADQLARANLSLEQARLRQVRAEQASERANRALAAAQRDSASATGDNSAQLERLAVAQQRASARSNDLALANTRVEQTTRSVTRATTDHDRASSRAADAVARMGTDSDRSSGGLRRLSNNLHEAKKAASGLGVAMTALKFTALAAGIAHLVPLLTQLVAGLTAVVGAIGPVVNALAVLPQMALGAGVAIGAVIAGFSGIGGALKAYGQQQAATGANIQKVERDNARAARDAGEAVVRAREQAAEATEAAARAVEDASRNLVDAQKEEMRALDDLNLSRKEAIQYLDDMSDRMRDTALSEEGAVISLEEAKIRLDEVMSSGSSSDLDRRKADLAYREAQARLDDAREAKAKAAEENAEAQAKGVEGSDIVVAAEERAAQAKARTADATRALSDAQKNQGKVARDSERAIRDALENQALATERAAAAMEQAAGGPNKFAEAMAKLGPAAQSFVKFLISLKPLLDDLKRRAQDAFLPGMEKGLRTLTENLAPMVGDAVVRMGKILGDGFADFSGVMGGAESQSILGRLFESNEIAARNTTKAMGPLYLAVARVADAFRPLAVWLSELVLRFGEWADATTRVNAANGDLATSVTNARESLAIVGDILKNFGEILYNVGKAGRETGMILLNEFNDWLKKWAEWTGSTEGQNSMKEYFEQARPGIEAAARLIGAIGRLFLDLGINPQTADILNKLAGPGMDAVGRIIKALTENSIGTSLTDGIISIAEGIATLLESGGGGVLSAFVESLSTMFDILSKIVQIPGVGEVLSGIAVAVGTMKAAKVVGAVTGVTPLVKTAGKAVKTVRGSTSPVPPVDPTSSAAASATAGTGIMSMMPWSRKKQPATPQPPPAGPIRSAGSQGAQGATFWGSMGMTPKDTKPKPERKPNATVAKAGAAGKKFSVGKAGAAASVAAGIGAVINFAAPEAAAGKFGGVLSNLSSILFGIIPLLPVLAMAIGALTWPITLVVGAIAAFVAGLVWLWKNNEGFRNFVTTAWNNIVEAVKGAWENFIWPTLQALAAFIVDRVVPVFQTIWGVVQTVFGFIGQVIAFAWNNIIFPIFQALWAIITNVIVPVFQMIWSVISTVFNAIATVFSWWWNNVTKPVFEAIGALISWWWNNVTKPVFDAVAGFITNTLVPIFMWFWNNLQAIFGFIGALITFWWSNVIFPILGLVGALFMAVWNNYIRPVFEMLGAALEVAAAIFTWFWETKVRPLWNALADGVARVYNDRIRPVLEAFSNFFNDTLVPAFQQGVQAVQRAWEDIRRAVAAPINWVIENVINRGIIDTFNSISKVVDGPSMTRASLIEVANGSTAPAGTARNITFADGGPVPYASGGSVRGRVRGQSLHRRQDNVPAALTAGEWVHPVDSARYYGSRFMEMVRRRMFPRDVALQFAEGGEAPETETTEGLNMRAKGGPWDTVKDIWNKGVDIVSDPVGAMINLLEKPVNELLNRVPGGRALVDWIKPIPMKIVAAAKEKITALRKKQQEAVGDYNGKGLPYSVLEAWIESQPGLNAVVTSRGRAAGTKTASGALSYHSLNRAIDIVGPNLAAIAERIISAYGVSNITELIYSPRGSRNIYHGRYYTPSAVTLSNHWDHVHWAMNQGGEVGGSSVPLPPRRRRRPDAAMRAKQDSGRSRYASGGSVYSRMSSFKRRELMPLALSPTPAVAPRLGAAFSPGANFMTDSFQGARGQMLGSVGRVPFAFKEENRTNFNTQERTKVSTVNVTVNNPRPERASESTARAVRRRTWFVGG